MTAGDFSTAPGAYRLWLLSSYLQHEVGQIGQMCIRHVHVPLLLVLLL